MCNLVALYQPAAGQLGQELKWILTHIKRRRGQVCLAPLGTVKKTSKKVKISMCKTKKIRVFSISLFAPSDCHLLLIQSPSQQKMKREEKSAKKEKSQVSSVPPPPRPPAILTPTGCQFGQSQSSAGMGSCGREAAASSDTDLEASGLCPGVDSGSGGSGWLRMTCTT